MMSTPIPAERAVMAGADPDTATLALLEARGWIRTQGFMVGRGGTWWWTEAGIAARDRVIGKPVAVEPTSLAEIVG